MLTWLGVSVGKGVLALPGGLALIRPRGWAARLCDDMSLVSWSWGIEVPDLEITDVVLRLPASLQLRQR